MNIEDLSKTQLLLLTILVNFVTSIATGIFTVSLLDQAPPTVVQTVNRIVDHTIDTVTTEVPVIGSSPKPVPSSEDLLTAAIAKESARTVSIYRNGAEEPEATGVYVADSRSVFTISGSLPGHVTVKFADGTTLEAASGGEDGTLRRFVFAADAALPSVPAGRLVPKAELKQGQTVIVLSPEGSAMTGIVSRIGEDGVATDLPQVPQGAAAVNLSGDIIGIGGGSGLLVAADRMSALAAP